MVVSELLDTAVPEAASGLLRVNGSLFLAPSVSGSPGHNGLPVPVSCCHLRASPSQRGSGLALILQEPLISPGLSWLRMSPAEQTRDKREPAGGQCECREGGGSAEWGQGTTGARLRTIRQG